MPDGRKLDNIQYEYKHSPAKWKFYYQINENTGHVNEKLPVDTLKECLKDNPEYDQIVKDQFDKDFLYEMINVANDIDPQTGKDSIDLHVKQRAKKRLKLRQRGHINEIDRSNRVYCNRTSCHTGVNEMKARSNLIY